MDDNPNINVDAWRDKVRRDIREREFIDRYGSDWGVERKQDTYRLPEKLCWKVPPMNELLGARLRGSDIVNPMLIQRASDEIVMEFISYRSPFNVHDVMTLDDRGQESHDRGGNKNVIGYHCRSCDEVFLVPSGVRNTEHLNDAMVHGCNRAIVDLQRFERQEMYRQKMMMMYTLTQPMIIKPEGV